MRSKYLGPLSGATLLGALIATVALSLGSSAFAQSNTEGTITGEVVSSSGPVAGAVVTVRNTETGLQRSRTSNESGGYRFAALPTGIYEVSVARQGFDSRPVTVQVLVGETTPVDMVLFAAGEAIEELVVEGQVRTVDTSVAETSTVVTALELERLPIARDINAVTLMAPGAVMSDSIFGGGADKTRQHYGTNFGIASLGGASAAENAYYINGMNVTNFRNGVGGATVPFHFYDQFQIKTGGFGAEFGRSLGGVVNTVTKRGSNDWQFGVGAYTEPDSLRSDAPDVLDPTGATRFDRVFSYDKRERDETYVYASGPIVEDRFFFYATYMGRNNEDDNYTGGSTLDVDRDDDPFWGLKLDWNITDNHTLEYTGWTDEHYTSRTTYEWDETNNVVGDLIGPSYISRGGENNVLKYTGYFGDNFTLSLLSGNGKYDLSTGGSPFADANCNWIYDSRTGGTTQLGCATVFQAQAGLDERDVLRVDAEVGIGDKHVLRFGVDNEDNTSSANDFYSGPGNHYYRYFQGETGDTLSNGAMVPAGDPELLRDRVYVNEGSFEVKTTGLYIEDEWDVTDTVTLRLGLRNETFDNRNVDGETFVKLSDQWAPRLGFSWDIAGDGSSKLFATVGRYHIPVANNTNIRMAGREFFSETWYVLDDVNADDTPQFDPSSQIGDTLFYADGTILPVETVLDDTIDPMYQDEYIIGYERDLFRDYVGGVSFTYRDLKTYIDDVTIDAALGIPGTFHYVLTNPGTSMHTYYDADGDGIAEEYNFSAEELGYDKGKRTYLALTFFIERLATDRLYFKGSYTWSHNYGNTEGWLRSDNGQDDAGITTLYDFPGLMEGAYGDLPNDRRHQLKFYANYELTQNFSLNGSFTYMSGRPRNAFGLHPTDPFAVLYGAESFFNQGEFTPRGSLGNQDALTNIDIGLTYQKELGNGMFTARMDVFNVLDADNATEVDEIADEDSGIASPTFGLPLYFQQPRTVRFGLQYDFGRRN